MPRGMATETSQRLLGRTALVSGAARGQGRAHALRLAAEGADLILFDICEDVDGLGYALGSREQLEETATMVESLDRRVHAAVADVRSRASLEELFEATAEFSPRLDVIVANAGIGAYSKLLDTDESTWQTLIDINLTGVFNTAQIFARRMVAAGNGGSIVLIGSVSGIKGLPFCGAYAAAKHGVHGLMRVMAQELGGERIRVNTVDPGPVDTEIARDPLGPVAMSGAESPDAELFLASFVPVLPLPESGMVDPSAISDAVAWLASDESLYVTGVEVPVDAGTLVR